MDQAYGCQSKFLPIDLTMLPFLDIILKDQACITLCKGWIIISNFKTYHPLHQLGLPWFQHCHQNLLSQHLLQPQPCPHKHNLHKLLLAKAIAFLIEHPLAHGPIPLGTLTPATQWCDNQYHFLEIWHTRSICCPETTTIEHTLVLLFNTPVQIQNACSCAIKHCFVTPVWPRTTLELAAF